MLWLSHSKWKSSYLDKESKNFRWTSSAIFTLQTFSRKYENSFLGICRDTDDNRPKWNWESCIKVNSFWQQENEELGCFAVIDISHFSLIQKTKIWKTNTKEKISQKVIFDGRVSVFDLCSLEKVVQKIRKSFIQRIFTFFWLFMSEQIKQHPQTIRNFFSAL